jgi:hypothetical protein
MSLSNYFFSFLFFVLPGLEFRASCFLGRCSATWVILPVCKHYFFYDSVNLCFKYIESFIVSCMWAYNYNFLNDTGEWMQGFILAKQALYYLSNVPKKFEITVNQSKWELCKSKIRTRTWVSVSEHWLLVQFSHEPLVHPSMGQANNQCHQEP